MTSFSSLPPELVLDILSQTMALALSTQPLVVHGQFSQLASSCKTCCYRQLAGVSKQWYQIIREEHMGKEVVFGVFGSEKDDEVLTCVKRDESKAAKLRKVDASLRGWQGWKSLPVVASSVEGEGEVDSNGFQETREVQLEKQRQQVLNRDRERLVQLLTACRKIEDFDIDVGFYSSIPHLPALFPSTIRTLTFRNCDARETFDLIEYLPLLDNLTLRLALDWRFQTSSPRPVPSCRLRKFELSMTAFASTKLEDILTLLSSSTETLSSLTLRNKGTARGGLETFLPVSAGLVEKFASQLEHLSIKDIPRAGRRCPGSEPTWSWFPNRPTHFPRLRSLQLTGLPSITPDLFRSKMLLSTMSKLERFIIEDFDSSSARSLVETLRASRELDELKLLEVAIATGRPEEGQKEAENDVEEWCRGEGRVDGRQTELRASWRMCKVDHYCGFW
ncbi:hypothetical protein JCM16303_005083 [Sporobolomyces ruberrimus]